MKPELQDKLFDKYPQLFVNKDKSIMESCMGWGIDCDDGWYDILSSLCWMIKQHEDNNLSQQEWKNKQNNDFEKDLGVSLIGKETEYPPVKFDQIKEKFGGLRVYFSGGDEYIEGLVSMTEAISYKLCEVCGNKGEANKQGWISTLCQAHRNS